MSRTDTAARVISASPDRVFAALTDPRRACRARLGSAKRDTGRRFRSDAQCERPARRPSRAWFGRRAVARVRLSEQSVGGQAKQPENRGGEIRTSAVNAVERTRTSTGLPPQAPEACASTNSATTAGSATIATRGRLATPLLPSDADDLAAIV